MAAAVAELLSPEAVTRTHQAAHQTIGALLERGQADGSFRTDLPAGWLVTASIALVHACSEGIRAGQIEERDAARTLTPQSAICSPEQDLGWSQATAQQPAADPRDLFAPRLRPAGAGQGDNDSARRTDPIGVGPRRPVPTLRGPLGAP
jgi:hypothetical protein